MDHFFQNIYGWWEETDKNMYAKMVDTFSDGAHFVEIGSFKGRSSCSMAVEIINSGKQIKFDCVDTWKGSEEHREGGFVEDEDVLNGKLFGVFLQNTKPISHIINPIQSTSEEASTLYDYESLDFVFIDGSHDLSSVIRDIQNWLPKVKRDGILAGHDYGHTGVQLGVDGFFGCIEEAKVVTHTDNSWWLVNKTFEVPPISRVGWESKPLEGEETMEKIRSIGMIPLCTEGGLNLRGKLKMDNKTTLWKRD